MSYQSVSQRQKRQQAIDKRNPMLMFLPIIEIFARKNYSNISVNLHEEKVIVSYYLTFEFFIEQTIK
jgi:hypothetical protein